MTSISARVPLVRCVVMFMASACISIIGIEAFGHGSSINVHQNDQQTLVVSGGLTLPTGFVGRAWDPDEDAALDDATNNRRTINFPGYTVSGMDPSAPLQLEVISRPDYTVPGNPERWLWFWSPTAKVTDVPGDARFDAIPLFVPGVSPIQIQQAALVMGPSTTIANQIGPFMNIHSHLVSYELRNASASQLGVYAFFARVTSPGLEPSDPFLLAFRNLISVDFFEEAVNDINNAAVLLGELLGDFNNNGTVDAADYVVWRNGLGTVYTQSDYGVWRANFGKTAGATGAGATGFASAPPAVPEPAGLAMLLTTATAWMWGRRSRTV